MSIAPSRVVWRIVAEVARLPAPLVSVEARRCRAGCAEVWIGSACGPRVAQAAPPFATLFHFWAHGLRSFLELHGQGDQLEGAASAALCERIAPDAIEDALARYREPLAEPGALVLAGPVHEAYRMTGGPCRASIVVACEREQWVLFRSHGPRRPLRLVDRRRDAHVEPIRS